MNVFWGESHPAVKWGGGSLSIRSDSGIPCFKARTTAVLLHVSPLRCTNMLMSQPCTAVRCYAADVNNSIAVDLCLQHSNADASAGNDRTATILLLGFAGTVAVRGVERTPTSAREQGRPFPRNTRGIHTNTTPMPTVKVHAGALVVTR